MISNAVEALETMTLSVALGQGDFQELRVTHSAIHLFKNISCLFMMGQELGWSHERDVSPDSIKLKTKEG